LPSARLLRSLCRHALAALYARMDSRRARSMWPAAIRGSRLWSRISPAES
jgi:hypothetical protein